MKKILMVLFMLILLVCIADAAIFIQSSTTTVKAKNAVDFSVSGNHSSRIFISPFSGWFLDDGSQGRATLQILSNDNNNKRVTLNLNLELINLTYTNSSFLTKNNATGTFWSTKNKIPKFEEEVFCQYDGVGRNFSVYGYFPVNFIVVYSNFSINDTNNNWCNGADMNKDGKVDGGDYSIWYNHLNQNCSAPSWCGGADADKDGTVTPNDYSIWYNNLGRADCSGF